MLAFQRVSPSKRMCSFPSQFELHVHPIEALSLRYWLYLISHIVCIDVITYAYIETINYHGNVNMPQSSPSCPPYPQKENPLE
jgi:hypothetical protein